MPYLDPGRVPFVSCLFVSKQSCCLCAHKDPATRLAGLLYDDTLDLAYTMPAETSGDHRIQDTTPNYTPSFSVVVHNNLVEIPVASRLQHLCPCLRRNACQ